VADGKLGASKRPPLECKAGRKRQINCCE
jgi:hypothetical protein